MNDVDIIMQDLHDSLYLLKKSKSSPKDTRKIFSDFVNLSQKLTSAMRKNYPSEWVASAFQGWNDITELFKKLRNYDEHVEIIRSEIRETTTYTMTDPGWEGVTFSMSGIIKNVNPLDEKVLTANVVVYEADPVTGRMINKPVVGQRIVSYKFQLSLPDTNKKVRSINQLLKKINNTELIYLASKCYEVLNEYYEFYKSQLEKKK